MLCTCLGSAGFRHSGTHRKPSKNHAFFIVLASGTPKDTPTNTPPQTQPHRHPHSHTPTTSKTPPGGPQGLPKVPPGAPNLCQNHEKSMKIKKSRKSKANQRKPKKIKENKRKSKKIKENHSSAAGSTSSAAGSISKRTVHFSISCVSSWRRGHANPGR